MTRPPKRPPRVPDPGLTRMEAALLHDIAIGEVFRGKYALQQIDSARRKLERAMREGRK